MSDDCSKAVTGAKEAKTRKINSQMFSINRELKVLEKKISTYEIKMKKQKQDQINYDRQFNNKENSAGYIERLNGDITRSETNLKDTIELFNSYRDDLKLTDHRLIDVAKDIKDKEKKLSSGVSHEKQLRECQTQIATATGHISQKGHLLQETNDDKIRTVEKINNTEERLSEYLEIKKKVTKLNDEKQVVKYAIKVLSKDIPHQLIESALPTMEMYAKEYLGDLSLGRMDIKLKTQVELSKKDRETNEYVLADDLEMEITVDGVDKKYALCSGGEKTRVDIAIHCAYATFMLNRAGAKLRTMFLDEVGMALDQTGKGALVELIKKMVTKVGFKKIFIISQDSNFNKLFDCILTVKKTSEGSQICLA